MNKRKMFKAFAVVNFIGLLTLFLFFRSGSFDTYFSDDSDKNLTSPNGGTPTQLKKDVLTKKIDSVVNQPRLSSSKSLVITENLDLSKIKIKYLSDTALIDSSKVEKRIMHSTKSSVIINPARFDLSKYLLKVKPKKKKKSK